MRKSIVVYTPEELPLINQWLAGCRFERSRITFAAGKSQLEIPYQRVERERRTIMGGVPLFRKWRVPVVEWHLRILHVENFHVHSIQSDHGRECDYFNAISWDAAKRRVELSTAFSRGLEITVGKLNMTAVDTGRVVREKTEWPFQRYWEG